MLYTITLSNAGNAAVSNIRVVSTLSAALDIAAAQWQCLGAGNGAACIASGTGALDDSSVALPAGRSLSWAFSVPVFADTVGSFATLSIDAEHNAMQEAHADDADVLVVFRNGFEP